MLKLTRTFWSVFESSAKLVDSDELKKALVSRKNSVAMDMIASVDMIEPRFVPSRRSTGTFRYMSRDAKNGAIVGTDEKYYTPRPR
mmetsp:Transcript_18176/g.42369  ORF Transcript_18176/g.42369 Transcript_18176/m.42369 type:complete len:86 (-) Transcript_18176:37-294(-)